MDSKFAIKPRLLRSPADFEEAAADWMRLWGYHSVRRTAAGRDGGIDVESVEAVAQVKAWMVPVGSPEIQQLKGTAHDGRFALFFSLTDYTVAAVRFADQAAVALFRFSGYNGEIEAVNVCARELLVERSGIPDRPVESVWDHPLCKLIEGNLTQLIGNPGFFVILTSQRTGRFVQAYSDDDGGLSIESVGDAFLWPPLSASEISRLEERGLPTNPVDDKHRILYPERLSPQQISGLEELGWPPSAEGDNYRIQYPGRLSPQQLGEIAEILARTLIDVHGAETPEDVEVTIDS